MRIQIVMRLVGQLILVVAAIMLVPFCYGLVFEEIYVSFLMSALLAAVTGGLLYYYGEPSSSYSLRDGFLTVSSIWILVSFLQPYRFILVVFCLTLLMLYLSLYQVLRLPAPQSFLILMCCHQAMSFGAV